MILKISRFFLIIMFCSLCFACGLNDAVEYFFEGCNESGAEDLAPEHKEVLEFAGWLDYVEAHVGRIDYYYDRSASYEGAVGYAHCEPGECYIEIAAKNRTDVEIATTIVHEAGHLDDDCKHGEYLPEKMENSFLDDFYAKLDSGEISSNKLSIQEIMTSGRIQDFYPSYKTHNIAMIIADNPGNENQTNLYVFKPYTKNLIQVSHVLDKQVKFVKQYNDYGYSQFSYRLKNPWTLSGDKILVSVQGENDNEKIIKIFDINQNSQKDIYTSWPSSGAVFSPDGKYAAIASLHVAQTIVIINIETANITYSLPKQYNTRDGIMAWIDNKNLCLYEEGARQIHSYNIINEDFEIIYKLQHDENSVLSIYKTASNNLYAFILTNSADRRVYEINLSGDYKLLVDNIKNDVIPAVNASGDTIAYYTSVLGYDSSYGRKLVVKNLILGNEVQYLDRFIDKDRIFFLDNDFLLISSVYSFDANNTEHDYRLWQINLSGADI